MPNYKPYSTVHIGTDHYSVPVGVASVKILYVVHSVLSTALSMRTDTDVVYVVPAGKVFHAVGCLLEHTAVSKTHVFYEGDTENAITTLKFNLRHSAAIASDEYPVQFSVAAGKYVTSNPQSTTIYYAMLIGYEASV